MEDQVFDAVRVRQLRAPQPGPAQPGGRSASSSGGEHLRVCPRSRPAREAYGGGPGASLLCPCARVHNTARAVPAGAAAGKACRGGAAGVYLPAPVPARGRVNASSGVGGGRAQASMWQLANPWTAGAPGGHGAAASAPAIRRPAGRNRAGQPSAGRRSGRLGERSAHWSRWLKFRRRPCSIPDSSKFRQKSVVGTGSGCAQLARPPPGPPTRGPSGGGSEFGRGRDGAVAAGPMAAAGVDVTGRPGASRAECSPAAAGVSNGTDAAAGRRPGGSRGPAGSGTGPGRPGPAQGELQPDLKRRGGTGGCS